MTIDLAAPSPASAASASVCEHHDQLLQFVYRASGAPSLLAHARQLLDAAPRELAESFEQAVRPLGHAS